MAQDFFNPSVSEAALAVIKKHLFADWFNEKPYQLLCSLYAYRGKTDSKVLKAVQRIWTLYSSAALLRHLGILSNL